MFNLSCTQTPLAKGQAGADNLEKDKMVKQEGKERVVWKYGFKQQEVDLFTVQRLIKSDYRCYSAGYFTDGAAVNDKWQFQDCLIFDIDDGLDIDTAYKMFSCYEGLIATTKSHTPEKHRFRIILPLQERTSCTYEEYTDAMRWLMDTAYPFLDKQCKDPARIYFGNSNAEFEILDGRILFDFNRWVELAKKNKKVSAWVESKAPEPQNDGTKPDWYRANWKTPQMLKALRHGDKFAQGSRNGTLYAWAKYFQEMGFADAEIRDVVFWLNSEGDGVPEREIESTIFRSMRLSA